MDYFALCHTSKENVITDYIYEYLFDKVKKGTATRIERKVFKIFDADFGAVVAYSGVWYIQLYSHYTHLPKYFYNWLYSYLKRNYNILPLFEHGGLN